MRRVVVALALLALPTTAAARQEPPPNFVVILTDDHGIGDVSAYAPRGVRTPSIDHLAAQGMLFTAMRANATVCSPTRAALLTGRYADRVGVPGVIRTDPADSWGYLDPSVPTLADLLRRKGYHTALVGKWHLGLESPNLPNQRGFDRFHGFLGDMMDSYTTHLRHGRNYLRSDAAEITASGHTTEVFTGWALDYLRERSRQPGRPFFLYLAYTAPHFPIEPPDAWAARVRQRAPELDERRALNVALVEHLDDQIGRVLAELGNLGLERNTVVVFTSDNGGSLPHRQDNGPWRGGTQSHYDGGLRVPFLVRWPQGIAPGSRSDYEGLVFDVFPTFLQLAGAGLPADMDAVSLVPALRGQPMPSRRDLYFVRREGGAAYGGKSYEAIIRDGWKLLQNDPYSPLELYNLRQDPHERRNLASENPGRIDELRAVLRRHVQRGGATPWQPPRPR